MLFCYCVALLTAFEHCLAFIVVCCSSLCMNVCIYVCVMVGCIHMTFPYLAHVCEQIFCLYCSQAIPFHHLLPLLQCRIMLFGSCKDWCLVFSIVACCKNFIFSKHEQQKHSMCVWALAHMVASVIKEWYLLHQQFTAAASEQTHMLTHTHPQIYVYICTHTHMPDASCGWVDLSGYRKPIIMQFLVNMLASQSAGQPTESESETAADHGSKFPK